MKVLSQNARGYITAVAGVLSRPQKARCVVYLAGLIWLVKFRSIRTIAAEYGGGDTDGLGHFIRHATDRPAQMADASQNFVATRVRGEKVSLIIDDTTCPRDGKKIEGIGTHHSGDGLIKGLCAVTAVVRAAGKTWVWDVVGYVSRKSVSAPQAFRSKIDIALEIINAAAKKLGKSVTVLMDSWYSCEGILNAIALIGWLYVAAVKTNRNVIINGRKIPVRNLAKGPRDYQTVRLSKRRVFRVAKRVVLLPKVGMVALFICKHRNHTRFFISNDLDLKPRQMVLLYDERFEIEFFHRDVKQHLGFGELFVRSRHCAQKHWTLVAVAYNLVLLMSRETNAKSFRRKVEHIRRQLPANQIVKFKFQT